MTAHDLWNKIRSLFSPDELPDEESLTLLPPVRRVRPLEADEERRRHLDFLRDERRKHLPCAHANLHAWGCEDCGRSPEEVNEEQRNRK